MAIPESITVLSSILLAALIALVPLLYPKYSLFVREAHSGLESLKEWDQTIPDPEHERKIHHQSFLTPEDTGFRQIEAAVDERIPSNRTIQRFIHVYEEHQGGGGIAFGSGGTRRLEQAYFAVEYEDGNTEVLLTHPFDVESVLELEELERLVRREAIERSHIWTTFLVLIWTSLSILRVL